MPVNPTKNDISISATTSPTKGMFGLQLKRGDDIQRVSELPFDDTAIKQAIDKWCDEMPGLDHPEVFAEAMAVSHQFFSKLQSSGGGTLIDQAFAVLNGAQFFSWQKVPYISIPPDSTAGLQYRQVLCLRSAAFKERLTHLLHLRTGKAPKQSALKDVVETLIAHALHANGVEPVHFRIASDDETIVIDLGDASGSCVMVTPRGWSTSTTSHHHFLRPEAMLPLPTPVRGGDIRELRPFLNVASDRDFILLISFLIACLMPSGPYPILILNGEQGSAKTSTSRFIRRLVDPNTGDVRSPPTSDQNLVIAARQSWLLAFDNLSSISHAMADAFCRLSTGSAFGTRRLYTDQDEVLMRVSRPVIINGISDLTDRSDLLERAVVLRLPPIASSNRRSERDLNAAFDEAAGRIFGALLNAVSAGLRKRGKVHVGPLQRMADFMEFIAGACEALPWTAADFSKAYRDSVIDQQIDPILDDPFLTVVVQMVHTEGSWIGTATELLNYLDKHYCVDARSQRQLPGSATVASGMLIRNKSALDHLGVSFVREKRSATRKEIRLTCQPKHASLASDASSRSREDIGKLFRSDDSNPVFASTGGFPCPLLAGVSADARRMTQVSHMTQFHPHFYFRAFGAN